MSEILHKVCIYGRIQLRFKRIYAFNNRILPKCNILIPKKLPLLTVSISLDMPIILNITIVNIYVQKN
jgi:hypothetical protein